MSLLKAIDGGLIEYRLLEAANCKARLPFSVRLDVIQGREIKTTGRPSIENPVITRWLRDQGILCAIDVEPTGESARQRMHFQKVAETDLALAQKLVQEYIERRRRDRSIPSDIVLWFASESEWFLFRLRFL